MEMFITISLLIILVFGTWVALWWWKLARKVAPYKDEAARDAAKAEAARREHESNVVIVPPIGKRSE